MVVWWDDAKEGGAILAQPRTYLARVFLPSFLAWVASLGVMAVFLAAYSIPVTFSTLMRICGGNSIANVTSVTPGGAGVTQAFNVASLNGVTDADAGDCVLRRAAARDDDVEHHPGRDPHDLGVRLERRQEARLRVVHRREGEGGRAEGGARREEAGEGRRRARRAGARLRELRIAALGPVIARVAGHRS